ncbi:MAG: AMP-binding protein [Firmicutes bacterium]|nr:AMP-binding protein [Bacillota bacterium]
MNKEKYNGKEWPVREVTDLKDIICSSSSMFAEKAAYLYKDSGEWKPVLYKQVKQDMDALGTRLIDLGLKGEKIAVIGETSYLWFLTYFATVCGVGVIVPLDRNLPAEELKNLVRRSGAKAIVYAKRSGRSIAGLFEEPYELQYFISMHERQHVEAEETTGTFGKRVWSLRKLISEGEELLEKGHRDFVEAKIDPGQMATLIFTSGTTGSAKGVMLSHKNIASNVVNMSRRERLPEGSVVLSILPTHHTFENTCVDWTTFYQGQTLAICEGIKHILQNMNEVHANVMVGVPLVFEKIYKGMLKQADAQGQGEKLRSAIELSRRLKLYNNPRLMKRMYKSIHQALGGRMEQFIAGGAAIDPQVIKDFEAMGIPMMQGYGMTECSPIIAVNQNNYSIAESVGRPMYGTTVRIEDPDKDGVGEIVCKSPSVMLGYYEDPAATAAVLKDGWLYTGDLGYMDENGFLYVTGRKKTVIVTKGGKNIFPEEIEEVLKQNDLVKECLVHGVTDKRIGNVVVTADIQPNFNLLKERHGEMTGNEIYHFYKELVDKVNDQMPPYKAIKRVNIREKDFEMTTTGKIKRYGNFVEGEGAEGSMSYREIKAEEKKHAEQVIADIKASKDPYLRYKTGRPITDIKQMFNSSVELFGDKVAFHQKFHKGEPYTEISYKQAQADVNGLGTALINLGLKGKRIGIIGDTYYQWESTYLAVIGGVGVVVPLDKELSAEELKGLIKDAEVEAILYSKRFDKMFRQMKEEGETPLKVLVNLDAEEAQDGVYAWKQLVQEGKDQVAQGDRQFLDAEIIGADMAVILYTSGTTGFAKGVMLSNTNLVEDLMSAPNILDVGPSDIFFSVLPVHHTYECTCAFLMPLYKGASIAFCEGLKYITKNLEEVKPTMLLGVPVLIEALYKRIWKAAREKGKDKTLKRLLAINRRTKKMKLDISKPFTKDILAVFGGRMRVLISGGAAIDPDILQFFNDIGIIAVQGYGLTECSPMAALNPDVEKDMRNKSVGHLLPGMGVKIIDKDEDGIGEICLSGGNIMMGYYNNPEATAAVLKDGWFHTGDQGYVDDQDFIYITGRKKNVIIADNGKNVFPEELEYELSLSPYINESMVWSGQAEGSTNATSIYATVRIEEDEVKAVLGDNPTDEQILELLWKDVDQINAKKPAYKKIVKLILRKREFDKTTGKKIRRFVEDNKLA